MNVNSEVVEDLQAQLDALGVAIYKGFQVRHYVTGTPGESVLIHHYDLIRNGHHGIQFNLEQVVWYIDWYDDYDRDR